MTKKVTLLNLAIPIFLEMLLFTTLGLMDTFMLSRISDQAAGAVSAPNQILNIVNIVFNIISAGAGVLISQFIGAKRETDCHKTVIVSYSLMTLLGALCSIILLFFGKAFLQGMQITEGLLENSNLYIKIVGSFIFTQALLNISTVTMRVHGYAKSTLKITALMNVLNVIGNALLIFGLFGFPKMGVAGVAISTTISRTVALIIALRFVFTTIIPTSAIHYVKNLPRNILVQLLKVGFPAALENMSYQLSQIVITTLIFKHLGETVYITRTYVLSILMLCVIFAGAIGHSNQILVGRFVGEGNPEMAYKECIKNFKLSFTLAIFLGAILFFFGEQFVRLFTHDPQIIHLGSTILKLDALLEPGRTFNIIIISGLRGSGDVLFPVIMAMIFMWGIAVLGAYIFVRLGYGLAGLWVAMILDEWVRGSMNFLRWKSKRWVTKSLVQT